MNTAIRDSLIEIGRSGHGLFSLVTPSQGLGDFAHEVILSGASSEGRSMLRVDARRAASTPLFWAQTVLAQLDKVPGGSDYAGSLSESLNLPSGYLIHVDHAEDLFALSNYPGCKNLAKEIQIKARLNQNTWVFNWLSDAKIPADLQSDIVHLKPLDPGEVRNFLESRDYAFSVPVIAELTLFSGGLPEYLEILAAGLTDREDHSAVSTLFEKYITDPASSISAQCRHRWLEILLMAKGYGSLKAIMEILASYPGARLTDIAKLMRNTLPAVRDYLNSLIHTGAVHRDSKHYWLSDPVLRAWLKKTSPLVLTEPEGRKPMQREPKDVIRESPGAPRKKDDFIEFD